MFVSFLNSTRSSYSVTIVYDESYIPTIKACPVESNSLYRSCKNLLEKCGSYKEVFLEFTVKTLFSANTWCASLPLKVCLKLQVKNIGPQLRTAPYRRKEVTFPKTPQNKNEAVLSFKLSSLLLLESIEFSTARRTDIDLHSRYEKFLNISEFSIND
ncbi:hypothetical protein FF38_06815 [Lucilia cuprina]|uniref:Uncharacterized protein n=1 Tax=Lucilia cuprina TaxID=7375 RepID=A0A0L0C6J8_LUCCU|nr:hypothetical protein FF38_06815 [Lucilia cuprina]